MRLPTTTPPAGRSLARALAVWIAAALLGSSVAQALEPGDLAGTWEGADGLIYDLSADGDMLRLTVPGPAGPQQFRGRFRAGTAQLQYPLTSTAEVEPRTRPIPEEVRRAVVQQGHALRALLVPINRGKIRLFHFEDEVDWDERTGVLQGIRLGVGRREQQLTLQDAHVLQELGFVDQDPPFSGRAEVPLGGAFRLEARFDRAPVVDEVFVDVQSSSGGAERVSAIRSPNEGESHVFRTRPVTARAADGGGEGLPAAAGDLLSASLDGKGCAVAEVSDSQVRIRLTRPGGLAVALDEQQRPTAALTQHDRFFIDVELPDSGEEPARTIDVELSGPSDAEDVELEYSGTTASGVRYRTREGVKLASWWAGGAGPKVRLAFANGDGIEARYGDAKTSFRLFDDWPQLGIAGVEARLAFAEKAYTRVLANLDRIEDPAARAQVEGDLEKGLEHIAFVRGAMNERPAPETLGFFDRIGRAAWSWSETRQEYLRDDYTRLAIGRSYSGLLGIDPSRWDLASTLRYALQDAAEWRKAGRERGRQQFAEGIYSASFHLTAFGPAWMLVTGEDEFGRTLSGLDRVLAGINLGVHAATLALAFAVPAELNLPQGLACTNRALARRTAALAGRPRVGALEPTASRARGGAARAARAAGETPDAGPAASAGRGAPSPEVEAVSAGLQRMGLGRDIADELARLEARGGGTVEEMLVRAAYDAEVPPGTVRRVTGQSARDFRDMVKQQLQKAYGIEDAEQLHEMTGAYLRRSYDKERVAEVIDDWRPGQGTKDAEFYEELGLTTEEALVGAAAGKYNVHPSRLQRETGYTPDEIARALSDYYRQQGGEPPQIARAVERYQSGTQHRLNGLFKDSEAVDADIARLAAETGRPRIEIERQVANALRRPGADDPSIEPAVRDYVRADLEAQQARRAELAAPTSPLRIPVDPGASPSASTITRAPAAAAGASSTEIAPIPLEGRGATQRLPPDFEPVPEGPGATQQLGPDFRPPPDVEFSAGRTGPGETQLLPDDFRPPTEGSAPTTTQAGTALSTGDTTRPRTLWPAPRRLEASSSPQVASSAPASSGAEAPSPIATRATELPPVGATAAPAPAPVAPVEPLRFGADDLVYGPSAGGQLRQLAERAGGVLLTDLEKPPELSWRDFSFETLDSAARSERPVHFDLSHVDDLEGVLAGQGSFASAVTALELRHIRQNWGRFESVVRFYMNDQQVAPPWLAR